MDVNDILKFKDDCIEGEKPYCSAACPAHVDVKLMIQSIINNDFQLAYKIYEKKILFPKIISRICTEPCREECIRNNIDRSVSIRLLEKAGVDYRAHKTSKNYVTVKKNKKVLIVGGSLSGMYCALDLTRKGYTVELYEKMKCLGGRLLDYDQNILPLEIVEDEVQKLAVEGVNIHCGTEINNLDKFEFDACFIAVGKNSNSFQNLIPQIGENLDYKVTLESLKKGVFINNMSYSKDEDSFPMSGITEGMKASKSIERYLKGASLTLERENEFFSETRLYTNIEDKEIKKLITPINEKDGFTEKEALLEAKRCLLCDCMECVKQCTFLKKYHGYPKTYIKDFSGMLYKTTGLSARKYIRQLNSCSMCGLCAERCPNHLDMGEICLKSKEIMASREDIPAAYHDFWLQDLEFSASDAFFMVKGDPRCQKAKYIFFPGCQLGASDPEYIKKTYAYLLKNVEGGVGLFLGCCGAPAQWSGKKDLLEANLKLISDEWEKMNKPEVILACPTCHKIFSRYLMNIKTKSLWDIMLKEGLPQECIVKSGCNPVALYDPCSSRYIPNVQKSVRELLTKTGYMVEELELHGKYAQCCGFGGLVSFANPNLASEITNQRIHASEYDYVTYCTNCRDDFVKHGKRTWHILDILFGRDGKVYGERIPPTKSEQRENRRAIKIEMQRDIWGEKEKRMQMHYNDINLRTTDEILKKADEDYILMENIKEVISMAEKSGIKILDNESGHQIAHAVLGAVTFWVEYLRINKEYVVLNVYKHRMQIVEDSKNGINE